MTPTPDSPGSAHALVLPSPDAGASLGLFFESDEYAAIAVVHGMGARAPTAFALAKERLTMGRGVVWVTSDEALEEALKDMEKPRAKALRKLLGAKDQVLLTFVSVKSSKITPQLKWWEVNLARVEQGYLAASLG